MTPDEKMGEVETDMDRLTTLVSSGQIGRILLATPVAEQERIAAVVRRLEGMAADVDLLVLEGSSTGSLLLDMKIAIATVFVVLRGSNAH
jgi:hypothetical protein